MDPQGFEPRALSLPRIHSSRLSYEPAHTCSLFNRNLLKLPLCNTSRGEREGHTVTPPTKGKGGCPLEVGLHRLNQPMFGLISVPRTNPVSEQLASRFQPLHHTFHTLLHFGFLLHYIGCYSLHSTLIEVEGLLLTMIP